MEDNARAHRAHIINGYLQREAIERMEWPAHFQDLNPTGHIWDMMQTAISARNVKPRDLQGKRIAFIDEFNEQLPKSDQIANSIGNIAARGHHARY
jgi:hypothetical protein